MSDTEGAVPQETEARSAPAVDIDSRYVGVGGWLLFFCVSLTVLNPALTLFNVGSGVVQNATYFGRSFPLLALVVADSAVSLAIAALSIYAGVSLWRVRPGAVKAARVFLIVGVVYAIAAPFSPLLLGLSAQASKQVLSIAVQTSGRGILYYVIWLNYLNVSKRVRATYPDARFPVRVPAGSMQVRWYHIVIAVVVLGGLAATFWYLG
jgi:Protein of unknown function (DUF2569)